MRVRRSQKAGRGKISNLDEVFLDFWSFKPKKWSFILFAYASSKTTTETSKNRLKERKQRKLLEIFEISLILVKLLTYDEEKHSQKFLLIDVLKWRHNHKVYVQINRKVFDLHSFITSSTAKVKVKPKIQIPKTISKTPIATRNRFFSKFNFRRISPGKTKIKNAERLPTTEMISEIPGAMIAILRALRNQMNVSVTRRRLWAAVEIVSKFSSQPKRIKKSTNSSEI